MYLIHKLSINWKTYLFYDYISTLSTPTYNRETWRKNNAHYICDVNKLFLFIYFLLSYFSIISKMFSFKRDIHKNFAFCNNIIFIKCKWRSHLFFPWAMSCCISYGTILIYSKRKRTKNIEERNCELFANFVSPTRKYGWVSQWCYVHITLAENTPIKLKCTSPSKQCFEWEKREFSF